MEDPVGGAKPASVGASVEKLPSGKKSRRGKRKRNGKNRAAPLQADTSQKIGESGSDGRQPEEAPKSDSENTQRKRKRRRRSRDKKTVPIASLALSGTEGASENGASVPAKASNGRNRKWRGLQGRPLATKGDGNRQKYENKQRNERHGQDQPPFDDQPFGVGPGMFGKDILSDSSIIHPDDLYAALDLGTNNCRLLIAQPTRPGQFRVVDAFSRIVRLGEGLGASARLSQDAMDRSVEALKICAQKLSARKIRKARLIATEACRAAENGEEFLARVFSETGLELEIINRQTEARLAVSGCSSLVGQHTRSVVLFDIGGGSSEIAVISIGDNRSSRLANHITHWTSLPVGVVTLSERHGGRDVSPENFEAMVSEVDRMLEAFDSPSVNELSSDPAADFHLIGTSGTVTTLAGVHLDLPRYDRRKVDGLWLSNDEVSAMQEKLLSWDFAARSANPCIGPDRADLVLAGCAILEAIRRRWPSPRLRVADRGLREGLLTEMMADDGVWRRGRPRRNFRDAGQV